MKAERDHPKYTITPKAEAAILRGHPWVYAEEITLEKVHAIKAPVRILRTLLRAFAPLM